jgi:hypothetical protein
LFGRINPIGDWVVDQIDYVLEIWMIFMFYLLQTYADALTLSPAALLSLWGNNLTGRIPPEMGNSTNLSELLVCLLYFQIRPFLLILLQTVLQLHYGYSTMEI